MRERYTPVETRGERGREASLRALGERAESLFQQCQNSPFGKLLVGLSFVLSLEACGGAVQLGPGKVKSVIPGLGRITVTANPDMEAALQGEFAGSIGISFEEGRERRNAGPQRVGPASVEEKYQKSNDLGAIVPPQVLKRVKKLADSAGE
jgi:hypothetical protein